MKRLLLTIGIYLGAFIVLNVGMYFVLKLTQPEHSAVTDEMLADSAGVLHGDSTLAHDDVEFDHEPDVEVDDHTDGNDGHSMDPASVVDSLKSGAPHRDHAEKKEDSSSASQDTSGTDSGDAGELATAIDAGVSLTDTPKSSVEISKLAKVLEGMKPDEAAIIAERLPTETIVELVMRMKSRNGAKMMASLPVPVAASVATRMAELSGVRKPS